MKVALIQMEIAEKNTPGNIVHGLDLLQEAAANSDIAVLPEIWTTGYSLGRIEEEAETIDGSTIAAVRKIANDHHCAVVAGSIPLRHKDGKIYNNTVVIDKQGSVVASYSKVHLFGLFNEERFFAAGDNFDTYELNGVICGSTICYDLRFPELYRHLSLQGAKIIFVPAECRRPGGIFGLYCHRPAGQKIITILLLLIVSVILKGLLFTDIRW